MTEDQVKQGASIVATIERLRTFRNANRQYNADAFRLQYNEPGHDELSWAAGLYSELDRVKEKFIIERLRELNAELDSL